MQQLYLYNNQLTGSIPTELGSLITRLTELDLSNNSLTGSIPTELGNLTSLTDLDLSSNELTGSIPAELVDLTSLAYLGLASNQLTGCIPSDLYDIADNDLSQLGLVYCVEITVDNTQPVAGEAATMSVTASDAASYQWQIGGTIHG